MPRTCVRFQIVRPGIHFFQYKLSMRNPKPLSIVLGHAAIGEHANEGHNQQAHAYSGRNLVLPRNRSKEQNDRNQKKRRERASKPGGT